MRIEWLIWDDWNVDHIAEHGVEPEEVEQICQHGPHLARRAGITRYGLPRYYVYGQTTSGRYLFIVLDREHKAIFYVVTARDMTSAEKRMYRQIRRKK